jgi:hypothetical protein
MTITAGIAQIRNTGMAFSLFILCREFNEAAPLNVPVDAGFTSERSALADQSAR